MKITKEEKQLYRLLDIINKIFGKTSDRTTIVGNHNKLYFHTLGYCGVFVSKDNEETLIDAYDFVTNHYELKQLPNKSFVLDAISRLEMDSQELYYSVLNFVDSRIESMTWITEMKKDYDHKIAKIAIDSGKWIKDEDVSYLKSFAEFEVFNKKDCLIIRSRDESCDIYLIFTDSVVIPDVDDTTQMKIDAYDNDQSLAEDLPEEFEDEEDPMA